MKLNKLRFCAMLLTITSSIPYAVAKGGQCDYIEYYVGLRSDSTNGVTKTLSWSIDKNYQYNTKILTFSDAGGSFIDEMVNIKKNNGNNNGGFTIQEAMSAERVYDIKGQYLYLTQQYLDSLDSNSAISSLAYKGQYKMKMSVPSDFNSDWANFNFVLNHYDENYPSSYIYTIDIDWKSGTGFAYETVSLSLNDEDYTEYHSKFIQKRLDLHNCKKIID